MTAGTVAGTRAPAQISPEEARAIAAEAYVYLYPLVLMNVTRRQMTNAEPGKFVARGPMNAFAHEREFPPMTFRDIVRPNFDVLSSFAWLDLTEEPVIVSVPDTHGRYYVLQMLDMWTDVFASVGTRTTGTQAQQIAVIPPSWSGKIPKGVTPIQAPTRYVWLVARIQTNGKPEYAEVNTLQDGLHITPLAEYGRKPRPHAIEIDPSVDMETPPSTQLSQTLGHSFFTKAAEIMKLNRPHIFDQPIVARMRRLGIVPGESFDFEAAPPAVKDALQGAVKAGLQLIGDKVPTLARVVNNWGMNTDTVGCYGTYYLKRACVAWYGLGANLPEDAIYPINLGDSTGQPLSGENAYTMHFSKADLPPVDAFWSVTLYDPAGFPVPNGIDRGAIGSRNALHYNADGSLDLYIQHDPPPAEQQSNWLPAPAGLFTLTMRLYAPRIQVINGSWAPPPVVRR